jgi:hypothetical protein
MSIEVEVLRGEAHIAIVVDDVNSLFKKVVIDWEKDDFDARIDVSGVQQNAEPELGCPSLDFSLLQSSTSGRRSWVRLPTSIVIDFEVADTEWVIRHNLGDYPSITLTNTNGWVVHSDVQYPSDSVVRVLFSAPFAGRAILR